MSVISRLKTWVNEILTASDLNAEFDNVVTGINNLLATSITNGDITHAPDGNSVFDALALKAPLSSPSFTTPTLGVAQTTSIYTKSQAIGTIVSGANNDFAALDVPANTVHLLTLVYAVGSNSDGVRCYIISKQNSGAGPATVTSLNYDFSVATTDIVGSVTNNGADTIVRAVVTTTAAGGTLTGKLLRLQ